MLHKGGGKLKEDLKSYRPVTLLPHCFQIYTNLIMALVGAKYLACKSFVFEK